MEIDAADLVERLVRARLARLEAETDPTVREAQEDLRTRLRDLLDALDDEP